jgi:hypothetical protein
MPKTSNVLREAQNMVNNIQQKSSRQKQQEQEPPSASNLEKYKQKLKQNSHNTSKSNILKTSVQETMCKLQDESRLNGGNFNTNNTNQFSSIDGGMTTQKDQTPDTF